jgi:hypothetical protein
MDSDQSRAYWLTKSPADRIAALCQLRERLYGDAARGRIFLLTFEALRSTAYGEPLAAGT